MEKKTKGERERLEQGREGEIRKEDKRQCGVRLTLPFTSTYTGKELEGANRQRRKTLLDRQDEESLARVEGDGDRQREKEDE